MSSFLPNGIAGTGSELALAQPIFLLGTGAAWYVDSAHGTDGATPAGKERARPLATLQQAVTNAQGGDIIVLLSTHDETLTSRVTIATDGLTIIGEGLDSNGRPSASLTGSVAANDGLFVNATCCTIQNIRFKPSTTAFSALKVSAAACSIEDCYFEGGATTDDYIVDATAGATPINVERCTFVSTSTGTTLATAPVSGFAVTGTDIYVTIGDSVFDDGTNGFKGTTSVPAAFSIPESGGSGPCYATNISLLRGAVFGADSHYYVHAGTATGGAVVTEA